jgi:hypothetical protein
MINFRQSNKERAEDFVLEMVNVLKVSFIKHSKRKRQTTSRDFTICNKVFIYADNKCVSKSYTNTHKPLYSGRIGMRL